MLNEFCWRHDERTTRDAIVKLQWTGRPWPWFHGYWMGRPWPWFHGSVDGPAVAVVSLFSGWVGRGRGSMVQWTGRPWPWFHGSLDGLAVAVVPWFSGRAGRGRGSMVLGLCSG